MYVNVCCVVYVCVYAYLIFQQRDAESWTEDL